MKLFIDVSLQILINVNNKCFILMRFTGKFVSHWTVRSLQSTISRYFVLLRNKSSFIIHVRLTFVVWVVEWVDVWKMNHLVLLKDAWRKFEVCESLNLYGRLCLGSVSPAVYLQFKAAAAGCWYISFVYTATTNRRPVALWCMMLSCFCPGWARAALVCEEES